MGLAPHALRSAAFPLRRLGIEASTGDRPCGAEGTRTTDSVVRATPAFHEKTGKRAERPRVLRFGHAMARHYGKGVFLWGGRNPMAAPWATRRRPFHGLGRRGGICGTSSVSNTDDTGRGPQMRWSAVLAVVARPPRSAALTVAGGRAADLPGSFRASLLGSSRRKLRYSLWRGRRGVHPPGRGRTTGRLGLVGVRDPSGR